MIRSLAGLCVDARATLRRPCASRDRATAARWIAANALAARGARLVVEGKAPARASVLGVRVPSFTSLIAALAAVPSLVDADTLPAHWRFALRMLGVPALDRPTRDALADGACVLSSEGFAACELAVDVEPHGYRVRVATPARMLDA